EITNASVLAYPNPTDNILKLNTQLTSYSQASIYLYDVTGRLVYQKQINTQQNTEELLLGQLDNGYYNYNIIADGVSILNGKVGVIK
ncbi:MAG TPA: T9SS type A sorting domain-containing protein, partial [Bacteroidia bacterium]|nr:T9SS type A sorting domain-containing protein [Bacteroidia bacterium]